VTAPRLGAGGIIAGKYTVRSILGDGGAVITYHCVSQQGQEVALKLYDPAVASHATVMKSLEQAYSATNALPPNSAAPIIDAGYDPPTLAPFSVTELLRLPSIAAQNRKFSPEDLIPLLKGLARSLDLAHLRQVVHGALKPTNVFSGAGFNPVIVTDFAANLPKAAVPSQEGFVSSAPWIAPEQAQSGAVTGAADVFGAGLLLFYCLTGKNYWRSCQNGFDFAGWQQELGASRAPASSRAAELGAPLSPALDTVFWKALAADPNDRFKSIGEMANVLEESLRQQVGSAATMALPMITGDAPSPLAMNLRPEPPRHTPSVSPQGASTVALNLSDLAPPAAGYGMQQPSSDLRMSQQGLPAANPMDMSGLQASPGYGAQGYAQSVQAQQGYAQATQSQQGYAGQGYGVGRDPAYPPPPVPNGAFGAAQPGGKSKILPIALGFTAVALLGAAATVLALSLRDAPPDDTGPVAVPATSTSAATTAAATAEPSAEPTAEPTAEPSAPKVVSVSFSCAPGCDKLKLDGKEIDTTKPLELAPGSYVLEASKSGYVTQKQTLEVKEGDAPIEKKLELVAQPVQTAPKPPSTGAPKPPSTGTPKPPTGGCKKGPFLKKC
jgi:eukaryotic-like serine/threonine-protein kinase